LDPIAWNRPAVAGILILFAVFFDIGDIIFLENAPNGSCRNINIVDAKQMNTDSLRAELKFYANGFETLKAAKPLLKAPK
jgi:hypothetical protein